jgi:hypothetical protein
MHPMLPVAGSVERLGINVVNRNLRESSGCLARGARLAAGCFLKRHAPLAKNSDLTHCVTAHLSAFEAISF